MLRAAGCSSAAALALLAGIGLGAPAWAQGCTSNSAPAVDMTQVSGGTWCETPSACTAQAAPTGTDAGKPFAGVFTDADGDDLTYAAGIGDDSTGKSSAFSSFGVNAAASRLSVQAKAGEHLLDVAPALPSPFETLVHLDATDPCGDTVRVYGKFTTSWTDVASVEIVSTPSGGAYDAGDRILVRVTFSGVVTVDSANGTPRLKIDLDATANSGERWANYESGSGTTALTFGYTVAAADASKDGIAVLNATLERNGGTVRLGSSAAGLLHRGLAHDTLHRVGRPVIEVVEVANDPSRDSSGSGAYGAFDTYVVGDEIRIDVKFNEPVVVTGGGDVRLRLDLGTDDATPGNSRKTLTHPSMLNGGRTLRFSYAVTSSDTDPDGVWVQTDVSDRVIFEPHDDQRVVSAATGVDADLTKSGLPTTGNARKKVDGSASASGPRPSSATVDGTKMTVTFDAALDEAVDTGALTYFFSVQDAGGVNSGNIGAHQHPLTVSVSGSTVTLALGNGAQAGERIKLNYRYQSFQRLLQDTDGNAAPEIKDLPVTNITGGAAGPDPVRAWLEGSSLRIAFADDLDATSQPAGSAFLVRTKGLDGKKRAVPGKGTASVTGSEVAVTLTATALRPNEEVVGASYAKPSASPLRGAGGDVRSFDNFDIAPTYVEKPRPALTASFHGMPAKHDGKRLFEFELRFSENFEGLSLSAFEAGALQVTNGRLVDAKRTVPGENRRITARVRPDSDEVVTLTLAATDDCDAADAICAADGRMLSAPVAATVAGPVAPAQGTALPALSVAAATADEGGILSFAVALSEAAATEVTVDYATSDGSATAGTDYQVASGTLTFAAGETEKTVEVAAISDTAAEGDETFTLTLSNASGATIGTASANGTVTNANDAPLTASFHGLPAAHDGFSAFGFELHFSEEVKLSQRTLRDGSALHVVNGRVAKAKRLAKGENRRWAITVQPDDPRLAGGRAQPFGEVTVTLSRTWQDCATAGAVCTHAGKKLSAPVSATVPGPVAATPLPVLSVADASADEGGKLSFAVTLDAAAAGEVTVDYATADGSATAGADYTAASGTLTFAAGETAKTVEVAALADTATEGDETFTLTLSNASGATIGTASATGTVANVLPPLTASFHGLPDEHDGSRLFAFEIRFSEAFEGLRLTAFKAGALQVTNGRIVDAKRTVQGESRRVTVRVRPSSVDDMTLTLPASTDCSVAGAICASDGRKLSGTATATVQGPALLSVADAEVQEGVGAAVVFTVTLSRAASRDVTVDYATRDGTATAGRDYTRTRGTLTFAAGELENTVRVPILDDSVDEGRETFTLKLMNARGAAMSDGEATGTIVNSDAVPQGWLARFGRTAAETHVDAVRDRLGADRSPGLSARFVGQPVPGPEAGQGLPQAADADGTGIGPDTFPESRSSSLAFPGEGAVLALHAPAVPDLEGGPVGSTPGLPDGPGEGGFLAFRSFLAGEDDTEMQTLTSDDVLLGTSFITTRDSGTGFSHGVWGRASRSGFSGLDGDTSVDGQMTGVMLGTDWKRKGTIFGMVLSRSRGTGTYSGASSGEIDVTLTGLVPWAGRKIGRDLSVWGAAGIGWGDMTVTPEGSDSMNAGIGWSMAAAGADGALTSGERLLGAGLRWHADALRTQTSSDATTGLAATTGATTRLRLGVTADWRRTLESGATLGPRLEAGLRHDGGDAETGFGLEIGGGIGFSDPAHGLSVTVDGRTLALHEDGAFARWGLSLGLSWDPPPETRRGWSLAARHSLGGASSGGVDALLGPEAFPGLPGTEGDASWSLEAAYGIGRSHGMVGSPYGQASGTGGVDNLRLGYRIEPDAAHAADARVDLWAEPGTGGDGHEAGAGLEWRW